MARRDIWAYDPEICDGGPCPMNCDHCPNTDKVIAKQAEEEAHVEMEEDYTE